MTQSQSAAATGGKKRGNKSNESGMMAGTSGTRKLVMRPVDGLIPFARNSRTHSDAQVAQIAASIRRATARRRCGHGRSLAMLGRREVPCIILAA
jgi:hypothetical protein